MVIGVTGSFGSGKTTVATMFRQLGAYVIDADEVCHSLMAPGKDVYKHIVKHFGRDILKKDRTIDRRKLAGIVFKDSSKLRLLNKLVHPAAITEIKSIIHENKSREPIVIDAALLVESGFYRNMDRLVVVKTHRDKQIERIILAKGLAGRDAAERIRLQAPLKKKLALADFLIDNSGTIKQTEIQVRKIWKQLGVGYAGKRKIRY